MGSYREEGAKIPVYGSTESPAGAIGKRHRVDQVVHAIEREEKSTERGG